MIRYRLRPTVSEWDGGEMWAAALPDGPITWIGGVGAIALDMLMVDSPPCITESQTAEDPAGVQGRTLHEIVMALREEIPRMPDDAEDVLAGFFDGLRASGIVERVEDGGS